MVVLGKHSYLFEVTGKQCNVQPFLKELGVAHNVPIVNGAIAYDCPHQHQTFILLFWNALHIPSMSNNLIPPFIMRERGIIVDEMPKIHGKPAIISNHTIVFPDIDLKIHLHLNGIFPTFPVELPYLVKSCIVIRSS